MNNYSPRIIDSHHYATATTLIRDEEEQENNFTSYETVVQQFRFDQF